MFRIILLCTERPCVRHCKHLWYGAAVQCFIYFETVAFVFDLFCVAAPWCTSSCCCSGFWFSWLTTFWNSGQLLTVYYSVSGPHWFQSGSGSSFLPQCGSWSGSREPNQSWYESWSDFGVTKRWILTWKIYVLYGQSTCSWIRIPWIHEIKINADPDPKQWMYIRIVIVLHEK